MACRLPQPELLRVKPGTGERVGQNFAFLDYDNKVDYDQVIACSGTFKWPDGRLCLIRVSNPPKKRRTPCNR